MTLLILLRILTSGLMAVAGGGHAPPDPAGAATPPAAIATTSNGVDFGDDASTWAHDGECDDKRFTGPGMTATMLLDDDIGHDASDCRAAFEAGDLVLFTPVQSDLIIDGINFGDDSGDRVNDRQCDDPRFDGPGAAAITDDADIRRDASDCAAAWQAGSIQLADGGDAHTDGAAPITEDWIEDGINFGTDSGLWANDGECDDPRFSGPGMTDTGLLDADIRADASDCLAGWRDKALTLIDKGDSTRSAPAKSIAN